MGTEGDFVCRASMQCEIGRKAGFPGSLGETCDFFIENFLHAAGNAWHQGDKQISSTRNLISILQLLFSLSSHPDMLGIEVRCGLSRHEECKWGKLYQVDEAGIWEQRC